MLPGCGDAIDAREAYTGQDIRTGETLPLWRRGLAGAAMFLPLVGGATVRTVVDGGGDFLKNAAKHGDEAVDALKHADEAGDAGEALLKHEGELDDVAKAAGESVKTGSFDDLPANARNTYQGYEDTGWKGNFSGQTPGTKSGKTY